MHHWLPSFSLLLKWLMMRSRRRPKPKKIGLATSTYTSWSTTGFIDGFHLEHRVGARSYGYYFISRCTVYTSHASSQRIAPRVYQCPIYRAFVSNGSNNRPPTVAATDRHPRTPRSERDLSPTHPRSGARATQNKFQFVHSLPVTAGRLNFSTWLSLPSQPKGADREQSHP